MNSKEIYENLENKISNIQVHTSIYKQMNFSEPGKQLWKEFNNKKIGNIHLSINNALIATISLEITKLFDRDKESQSFYLLIETMREEKHKDYDAIKKEYEGIVGNHRYKKIKELRNRVIAHNSWNKSKNGFSMDDIDFPTDQIRKFTENLFRVFNPSAGICKDISKEANDLSVRYFKYLLNGANNT